jgi:hypothetical protein
VLDVRAVLAAAAERRLLQENVKTLVSPKER